MPDTDDRAPITLALLEEVLEQRGPPPVALVRMHPADRRYLQWFVCGGRRVSTTEPAVSGIEIQDSAWMPRGIGAAYDGCGNFLGTICLNDHAP